MTTVDILTFLECKKEMAIQRPYSIIILFLISISCVDRNAFNFKFYAQAFTLVPSTSIKSSVHFEPTSKTQRRMCASISSTLPSSMNGGRHSCEKNKSSPSRLFASILQEDSTNETSSKLVTLLVNRWNSNMDHNNNDDIDMLIQTLVDSKVICLFSFILFLNFFNDLIRTKIFHDSFH